MVTDYDTPRAVEIDDAAEDSVESLRELAGRRGRAKLAVVDADEAESGESVELPGADLSAEEFSVLVIPQRADEFTCSSCFLVHHRSQLTIGRDNQMICTECAS
jgi:hypothetical protein